MRIFAEISALNIGGREAALQNSRTAEKPTTNPDHGEICEKERKKQDGKHDRHKHYRRL